MKANQLAINEISIYGNRNEVCIEGHVQQGVLSYPTSLFITHSQLNKLLGVLQKTNPAIDIAENIESQMDPEGNVFMRLNFQWLNNNVIPMDFMESDKTLLKIRA